MLRIVPGTLSILMTWLLILGVFAGIGLLLRRAFGLTTLTVATVLEQFWVGFGATILFLIIWNFWFVWKRWWIWWFNKNVVL